jgi:hypothetical protein
MLVLSVALAIGATGCGTESKKARRKTAVTSSIPGIDTSLPPTTERGTIITDFIPPGQRLRGDSDADNPGDVDGNGDIDPEDEDSDYPTRASYRFPDSDDKTVFDYGHRPSIADSHAIESVVKRYFNYAGAGDGAGACSLLLPGVSRSIPETYGLGASTPQGKTCQAILSMLFRRAHGELAEPITVVDVRVKGAKAQVVLGSRKMRAGDTVLGRQGGSWKVEQLLERTLP